MGNLLIFLTLFICGLVFFGLYLSVLFESIKRKYFLAFLLLVIAPFYIYKFSQYFWYLQKLPSVIKVAYPVTMGTEGDLADGCDVTVFKLSESTIKNIETQGIKFFEGAMQAQGRSSYDYRRYNNWKETPTLPMWKINRGEDNPIRCAVISDVLLNQITETVMQKGSYYTANSEIELMVIPTLGFAVIIDTY